MKRREFLNIAIPATGAILAAPGFMNFQARKEIAQQFSGSNALDQYDVVINGAGLSGYFAGLHAAKQGKKVLIVEKRTSPGYEITAKKKLWLGADGLESLSPELIQLFFPENEKQEIHNDQGRGVNGSLFDDELLLFAGSVRKGMLRNLILNKVHVLLMTDVCGIFSDDQNVQGVLLASKHGLQMVKCRSFIDASDSLLFSRGLARDSFEIDRAGFVLEMVNVTNPKKKQIEAPGEFGIHMNKLQMHQGKHIKGQAFIEFEFPLESQKLEDIEHQARRISANISKNFATLDESLSGARVEQFAMECSLALKNDRLPQTFLKGHYLLDNSSPLTCEGILATEQKAKQLIKNIKYSNTKSIASCYIHGAKIPFDQFRIFELEEPDFSVPLKGCAFDFNKWVTNKEQTQVLVAGGGTSGAMAAMGSVEKGANTIVVDYFNDLGGTKTMGGVMGYYHGYKESRFFKKQDVDSNQVAREHRLTSRDGRKLYHLNHLLNGGGRFISSAITCGTLVDNNKKVEGILICCHGKLQVIESFVTIDATGDGDLAAFAGATFQHGNIRNGLTQNYSQWDISGGASKLPSPTGRDYDIIDNTKISELQRGLFLSHYEAHFYDFYPFLTVRESRRIDGLYTLDLVDAVEKTHYKDVVSLASSDFDPHYVGLSEYTRCGFLLPHSNILTLEIPYRCIVPKGLDGMLISGKAFSQTQDALQFTRMSADLAVLGYMTGQIAADQAWKKIQPKEYDISEIQKEWAGLGYMPEDYQTRKAGKLSSDQNEIERRAKRLAEGAPEYLYECIRLPKSKALPVLRESYKKSQSESGKKLVAKALAWFGDSTGNKLIEEELNKMFDEELRTGYPGGYIENYDLIRGREKNILEGLFWRINQNIALLAMSGNPECNKTIKRIIDNTTSGGPIFKWTGDRADYFNDRIDLRLIPYHNRILNLCFYAERLPDASFIPGFEKILKDENISGFVTVQYEMTRWRLYRGDLELYIGATLARCGSKQGYEILVNYLDDIHYNFKQFASSELENLTNQKFRFEKSKWKKHVAALAFPQPCRRLINSAEV